MRNLQLELLSMLRSNSRMSVASFSKLKGFQSKRVHYYFNKLRREGLVKLVPVLNFEALGFIRVVVFFEDSIDALAVISRFGSLSLNNSMRLDRGLFAEYVFLSKSACVVFLNNLEEKGLVFEFFFVGGVLKQEALFV